MRSLNVYAGLATVFLLEILKILKKNKCKICKGSGRIPLPKNTASHFAVFSAEFEIYFIPCPKCADRKKSN